MGLARVSELRPGDVICYCQHDRRGKPANKPFKSGPIDMVISVRQDGVYANVTVLAMEGSVMTLNWNLTATLWKVNG